MSNMVQHEQSDATWAIWCNMRNMVQHKQYGTTWAICCNMRNMVQHKQYGTTWAIWCNMSNMVQHEQYGTTWAIWCNMNRRWWMFHFTHYYTELSTGGISFDCIYFNNWVRSLCFNLDLNDTNINHHVMHTIDISGQNTKRQYDN